MLPHLRQRLGVNMTTIREQFDEIIKFVAENWENEQEYAGRMETWCFYCGKYQEPREPQSHKEDCLHLKALKLAELGGIL